MNLIYYLLGVKNTKYLYRRFGSILIFKQKVKRHNTKIIIKIIGSGN